MANEKTPPGAFYERVDADRFSATSATASPWGEMLQHGSPPTALLVHALGERHPRDDMRVARVAADFLGPIPLGVVTVRTRVLRPGRRIEMLEGAIESGGRDVVVVRVWRIATQAAGSIPDGVTAHDAVPALPPEQPQRNGFGLTEWGYGDAFEWRFLYGGIGDLGPAAVWSRAKVPLIAGEPLQPLDRLLLVVDSANGISGELPFRDWLFVPPSLSLALLRYPEGDWTYMEARTAISGDGLGVTSARYGDPRGFLGAGTQALFVESRAG
jgi:hypothetical protein